MTDAPSFRCPACAARPGTAPFDRYVFCAACDAGAHFREWLDPATATPALSRAAEDREVRLASSVTPRFPERCVVCNRERVGGGLQVTAQASTWASRWLYGWLISLFVAKRVVVEAPACGGCADRFGRGRFYRWLLTWGLAFATYILARAGLHLDRGPARLVAVAAWGAGWFAGLVWLRAAIEVEVEDEVATYTFDHAPYAVEFARLNSA